MGGEGEQHGASSTRRAARGLRQTALVQLVGTGPQAELAACTGAPWRGWGWRSPSVVSWHWLSGSDFSMSWQRARLWESREGCGVAPTLGCGTPPWQSSQEEGGPGRAGGPAGRVAVGVWADR